MSNSETQSLLAANGGAPRLSSSYQNGVGSGSGDLSPQQGSRYPRLVQSSSTGSISAPGSASHSPAAHPAQHPIKLEDHRPGRRTTFSLLVGNRGSGRYGGSGSESISPPLSPSSDRDRSRSRERPARHLLGHRSNGSYDSLGASNPLGVRPSSVTLPSSSPDGTNGSVDISITGINGTPYRYGDGTQGYHILFPTPEEDALSSAEETSNIEWHVNVAIWLSLLINIALFVSKTFSAIVSKSLSVAASAVDSFLDLASQGIVFFAERGSKNHDQSLYPAGRSRLEPVGIILCAALMGMAALQLILESSQQLYAGFTSRHDAPHVQFDVLTVAMLVATVVAKIGLWVYCAAYAKYSPTLYTLAVDHRNDVYSNIVALVAALLAWKWPAAWCADPIGAILMSLYICANWFEIGNEQIEMIVGRAADPEFLESIRTLSSNFHPRLVPDIIRAYHFGAKYLVELEVILPADMTVREAHDISLALQQSIEQLPAVERAFVHVDYKGREGEDEHNALAIAQKVRANSNEKKQQQQNKPNDTLS